MSKLSTATPQRVGAGIVPRVVLAKLSAEIRLTFAGVCLSDKLGGEIKNGPAGVCRCQVSVRST